MKLPEKLLDTLHTCPVPEVARLGRTLRAWRAQVLADTDTDSLSNGGTEAINMPPSAATRATTSTTPPRRTTSPAPRSRSDESKSASDSPRKAARFGR
jgi:hypothetical protein